MKRLPRADRRRYVLTTRNTHWAWPNTCELSVTTPGLRTQTATRSTKRPYRWRLGLVTRMHPPPDAARRPALAGGRCRQFVRLRVRSVNGPQDSGRPRLGYVGQRQYWARQ